MHQLLKSTVMYLIQWLEMIIKNIISTISLKRKCDSQTIADTTHDVQLNQRFQVVLSYSELKRFHDFLFVKQWIDVKQKIIMHQLIAIITSLLIKKHQMRCIVLKLLWISWWWLNIDHMMMSFCVTWTT